MRYNADKWEESPTIEKIRAPKGAKPDKRRDKPSHHRKVKNVK